MHSIQIICLLLVIYKIILYNLFLAHMRMHKDGLLKNNLFYSQNQYYM